jgi:hypothetical protein
MTDMPLGPSETFERDNRPVEFRILGALRRWALPILVLTVLAAGATWIISQSQVPVRSVQSELLVRIGYEYSPVPWTAASETQQINFRADEVIGTEIQLMTSEGIIQKALAAVPNSAIGAATDGRYDAAQVLALRQKLSVKRLEGSNVILVEIRDPDPVWSVAFSQALLDAYLQDRSQLFSNPAYDTRVDADVAEAVSALAAMDGEARMISQRIAETTDYLADSAAALAASPAQMELRIALARDIRGLQIYVSGMERMSYLRDTLDRLGRSAANQSSATAATATGTRVSDELLKTAVEQFAKDAARLNAIADEREGLVKRLETFRIAQQRKALRDETSHNMTIMTPPRLLATSNGLGQVAQTVLVGLMALILSCIFFVYIDGLKRRSSWRADA